MYPSLTVYTWEITTRNNHAVKITDSQKDAAYHAKPEQEIVLEPQGEIVIRKDIKHWQRIDDVKKHEQSRASMDELCVFCDYCGLYTHMYELDRHAMVCRIKFIDRGRSWPKIQLKNGRPFHHHAYVQTV